MSVFTPQNLEFSNYGDRLKFLLIWRLSLALSPLMLALTIIFVFDDSANYIAYGAMTSVILGSLAYLHFKRDYKTIFIVFSLIGTALVHLATNTILDVPHYADFLWIVLIVLLCFFGLGNRWGIAILSLNVILISYFVFFSLSIHLTEFVSVSVSESSMLMAEIVVSSFLIGYIIHQFTIVQRLAEKELLRANKELEENNDLIHVRNNEKTILLKEILSLKNLELLTNSTLKN